MNSSRQSSVSGARLLNLVLLAICISAQVASASAGPVTAYKATLELPTYPWAAVKHPYFRGTDKVNIYPYPMLDFLSREKTTRKYQTVVLENDYLRITFLPELGGKIHEVIDKTTGKPMFYVNHVIKPGLIGQCGAWTSGGVEWNTGPQGHTVSCMQPVSMAILPNSEDGSRSVAIGETERIYGTKWTVVVTLHPGRSFIEERIRIYNPTETVRPYYFWNCTAAPNTPGFRFIYPMTLGCDHAGEKFFRWPVDNGKYLSSGTNYQDAASIFAWHCDQDFFGSYNDDLRQGVVSYANHHQLPGKKAWTWGNGGFGMMHQMDLTDEDGPYNEVQTGPLLTQAQVGQLNPCEAVEWKEWWYPIHETGGFTFANRELAANVTRSGARVELTLLGTKEWKKVEVQVRTVSAPQSVVARRSCRLSPREPAHLNLTTPVGEAYAGTLLVQVVSGDEVLASFQTPLAIPDRQPPEKPHSAQTPSEIAEAAWQHFLFARFSEAEKEFNKALDADPRSASAETGLALLKIDSDPAEALKHARSALSTSPDSGLAHLVAARAQLACADAETSLDEAWLAALDPATAVAGRALAAKLLVRQGRLEAAAQALEEVGPWSTDPLCRNRLAFILLNLGVKEKAVALARENLRLDPLDSFACSILWLAKNETRGATLRDLLPENPAALSDLMAAYSELLPAAIGPLQQLVAAFPSICSADPLLEIWAARYGTQPPPSRAIPAIQHSVNLSFPWNPAMQPALEAAIDESPTNGVAALYLGDLLFHLGRYADGRRLWQRAAELGADKTIAYRSLGMAAKALDGDYVNARQWLEKANAADPTDGIVSRDLANVLSSLAEKAASESEKKELAAAARDRLLAAFETGRNRSDFVALLARSQNQLGQFKETAAMLDKVRVTVWEGAHEVHDLYAQAHIALGQEFLTSGQAEAALAEFDRALQYPANLATGKLENAPEADIQLLRGNALAALGRPKDAQRAWKLAAEEPPSKEARIEKARGEAKAKLQSSTDRK